MTSVTHNHPKNFPSALIGCLCASPVLKHLAVCELFRPCVYFVSKLLTSIWSQHNAFMWLPLAFQVQYLHSGIYYYPRSKGMQKGNVFTGICPFTGGYPTPRFFSWSQVLSGGMPVPARKRGTLVPARGTPPGTGVPPPPRRQFRRVSAYYTAGSTPLVVMQEDFLVSLN